MSARKCRVQCASEKTLQTTANAETMNGGIDCVGSAGCDMQRARWFVMRAYKREREAEQRLAEKGLEYFIPKCYAIRIYHGVKQKKLVPAIPGLVFVRAGHTDITDFKKTHNFLQFVVWKKATGPAYLVVDDREMANFMKAAAQHDEALTYYRPDEIDLENGTRVRILGGRFDGVEGIFVRCGKGRGSSKRVVVRIEGLLALTIETTPDLLEVIE